MINSKRKEKNDWNSTKKLGSDSKTNLVLL